jgi:hypothetical protein
MRTSGLSGKGLKKAIPITDIFQWCGEVCNFDLSGTDIFCCVDADTSEDGVYEHCDALGNLCVGVCEVYSLSRSTLSRSALSSQPMAGGSLN